MLQSVVGLCHITLYALLWNSSNLIGESLCPATLSILIHGVKGGVQRKTARLGQWSGFVETRNSEDQEFFEIHSSAVVGVHL